MQGEASMVKCVHCSTSTLTLRGNFKGELQGGTSRGNFKEVIKRIGLGFFFFNICMYKTYQCNFCREPDIEVNLNLLLYLRTKVVIFHQLLLHLTIKLCENSIIFL